MPKTYVTFGQRHTHRVNGITFDCECVAVIEHPGTREQGRALVFETFDNKWCMEYYEDEFDPESLKYYPRGLINVFR